jgi:hypothetical protein
LIDKIKDKAVHVVELYDTPEKKMALEDITTLLTYLYKNFEYLVIDMDIDEQFAMIVTKGGLEELLKGKKIEREKTQKKKNACCTIF